MNLRVIALVGVSGVGKTTLLRNLELSSGTMHLQASALIQEERLRVDDLELSAEDLRNGPVVDNQALLVAAFCRKTKDHHGLAILDGHVVIDTETGLVVIPSSVFSSIGIERIIVVQDYPHMISERRLRDLTRERPKRSEEEIAVHQARSLEAASRIALELDCPLSVVTSRHDRELSRLLTGS